MIYLTPEQIIGINARHLGGQPAVRDAGAVAAAAARPGTVVFSSEVYPTLPEKAAALLHSLICNHPFLDGNKRTAWAATEAFMIMNRADRLDLSDDTAYDLVMRIAETCADNDIKGIAAALEGP